MTHIRLNDDGMLERAQDVGHALLAASDDDDKACSLITTAFLYGAIVADQYPGWGADVHGQLAKRFHEAGVVADFGNTLAHLSELCGADKYEEAGE